MRQEAHSGRLWDDERRPKDLVHSPEEDIQTRELMSGFVKGKCG
jgi:hypothetical protein